MAKFVVFAEQIPCSLFMWRKGCGVRALHQRRSPSIYASDGRARTPPDIPKNLSFLGPKVAPSSIVPMYRPPHSTPAYSCHLPTTMDIDTPADDPTTSTARIIKHARPQISDESIQMPWVEKYRPSSLEELVAHEDIVSILTRLIDNDNLPHLLLYGPPGTGKVRLKDEMPVME